jgi:hypothetical protein
LTFEVFWTKEVKSTEILQLHPLATSVSAAHFIQRGTCSFPAVSSLETSAHEVVRIIHNPIRLIGRFEAEEEVVLRLLEGKLAHLKKVAGRNQVEDPAILSEMHHSIKADLEKRRLKDRIQILA